MSSSSDVNNNKNSENTSYIIIIMSDSSDEFEDDEFSRFCASTSYESSKSRRERRKRGGGKISVRVFLSVCSLFGVLLRRVRRNKTRESVCVSSTETESLRVENDQPRDQVPDHFSVSSDVRAQKRGRESGEQSVRLVSVLRDSFFRRGEEEKGGEKKKTSSKKNRICVFFRPAPRDAKRARLIIHSHGNAMDCGGGFEMLAEIGDQLDVSILSYDYRGYGKSGDVYDQPTAESCAEDLRRVVAWATKARGLVGGQTGDYNRDRFGLDDIVLWGQSIGSGPSTKVATEKEVGGLILECALASGTRVLIGEAKEKHGILSPVRCFRKCEVYDNQGLAVNVKCPALVMHGMKDFEIHHSHSKLIFDKLQARGDSKERFKTYAYWSQTAGHDDVFYDNPRECIRQVQKFVRTLPTTERIQNAIASSSRAEKGLSADDLANPSLLGSERRRENKEKKPYNDKFNRVNQELFYQSPPKKQHMKK